MESTISDNTYNLESGCGSNFLLNVINSKDLKLDIEDTNEFQSL